MKTQNELLVFSNLEQKVLDSNEPVSLLGVKNLVHIAETTYDLLFRLEKGIYVKNINEDYLNIPVLVDKTGNNFRDKVQMASFHSLYPHISTIALIEDKPNIVTTPTGEKIHRDKYLGFYDISNVELGTEVKKRQGYNVTTEGEFIQKFPDWGDIKSNLLNDMCSD